MTHKLDHVVYWRTQPEEIELLTNGDKEKLLQYVRWHGIRSPGGQEILAQSDDLDLIRMQQAICQGNWHRQAEEILYNRNILQRPDIEKQKSNFENWLFFSMHGDRRDEKRYGRIREFLMAGAPQQHHVSEEELFSWLDNGDEEKILNYSSSLEGAAFIRFLKEASENAIFRLLHYRLLKNEEEQIALVERVHHTKDDNIIWFYFCQYSAFPSVQQMLQDYGSSNLWRRVLLVNYGYDFKYEKKFGCLKEWQKKLKANFSLLEHCPVQKIAEVLDGIS